MTRISWLAALAGSRSSPCSRALETATGPRSILSVCGTFVAGVMLGYPRLVTSGLRGRYVSGPKN